VGVRQICRAGCVSGTVIGIVAFLLLLAKISMYAAELNLVLARRLYLRALPLVGDLTDADRRVLGDLVHAERRRDHQAIGVGFGDHAAAQLRRQRRREQLNASLSGVRTCSCPASGWGQPTRRPIAVTSRYDTGLAGTSGTAEKVPWATTGA
jgi:hypothetical protein